MAEALSANASALFAQALASEKNGHFPAAIDQLQRVIMLQSDHLQAMNKLGNLFRMQGQFDLAIQQFKKAAVLSPDSPALMNNLGGALAVSGDLGAAALQFKQAIQIAPNELAAYQNLFNVYQAQGDYPGANAQFSLYIKEYPVSIAAKIVWSMVLVAGNRLEQAEHVLSKLVNTQSEPIVLYELYASVLRSQGKSAETVPVYQTALEVDANHLGSLKGLAKAHMSLRCFDEAALAWQRVLTLSPTDGNANIDYGFVRSCTGSAARKQLLAQLDEDTVYSKASDVKAIAAKLVETFPMSDAKSRGTAQAIFAEFQPEKMYSQAWWDSCLARFTEEKDDKVLRGVTSMVLSWSLPTQESLVAIAEFACGDRLFSYGAGGAYWEYLLSSHFSQSIIATDIMLGNRFMPTQMLDMNTAQANPEDVIFISWIRTVESVGEAVIRLLKSMVAGQKLIIIGDHPKKDGTPRTCGTLALFTYLRASFTLQVTIQLPHFIHMHDAVCLYEKNAE